MAISTNTITIACVILVYGFSSAWSQKVPKPVRNAVRNVRVRCNNDNIQVTFATRHAFDGMIYPRGMSRNSSCMTTYADSKSSVEYSFPLSSCNTMSVNQKYGVEFYNTIVVQPHRKLVTNLGRGYHIRCKYKTNEKAIKSALDVGGGLAEVRDSESLVGEATIRGAAPMPTCTMQVLVEDQGGVERSINDLADSVKIGDPLILRVSIEDQPVYGLSVTDCVVRDGLGWSEQVVINDEGCPSDMEIMGEFVYNADKTSAEVHFLAHKFPYTMSVYYQCNVRMCLKSLGGCDDVPPVCVDGVNRRRHHDPHHPHQGPLRRSRRSPENATVVDVNEAMIKVFKGFSVREGSLPDDLTSGAVVRSSDGGVDGSSSASSNGDDILCIAPRTFAIVIACVGLLLMLAVIVSILVLLSRRRHRRAKHVSMTGSSIYSGPYTNTAYSHSS